MPLDFAHIGEYESPTARRRRESLKFRRDAEETILKPRLQAHRQEESRRFREDADNWFKRTMESFRFRQDTSKILETNLQKLRGIAGAALGPEAAVAGAGLVARQRPQVQIPTIKMQPRQLPAMPRSLLDIYTPEELAAKHQAAAGPAPGPGELFRRPIEAVEAVSREVLPRVIGPETRIQVGPVELGGRRGEEYAPYPETAEALEKLEIPRKFIKEKALEPTVGRIPGPVGEYGPEVLSYIAEAPLYLFPGKTISVAGRALRGARLTAAESRLLREAAPRARELLVRGEAGAARVPGKGIPQARRASSEGLLLTNDIPAGGIIAKKLDDVETRLSRVKSASARRPLLAERAKLQAQREIDETIGSGVGIDEQMSVLQQDLQAMEDTLNFRVSATKLRRAPRVTAQFGTDERYAQQARRDRFLEMQRTGDKYPELSMPELIAKERVYREFVDNMRIQPVAGAMPTTTGVEPTVGRLRMTETGELVPESTFATERELAGLRETQVPLGIGAGERPIEELPMFRAAPAPAREAVPPRGIMPAAEEAGGPTARPVALGTRARAPSRGLVPEQVPPQEPPLGPGGAKPPSGGGRGPRGPDPSDAFNDVLPGERPSRAKLASYEGQTGAVATEVRTVLSGGERSLKQLKPTQDELTQLAKALHGEGPVPARLQPVYADLRALYKAEEDAMRAFDPKFPFREGDYAYRGWRAPKETRPGAARVGAVPGFKKPRAGATFTEMLEDGWEPLSWNPYEMYAVRRIAGVEYREQSKLIRALKGVGEAVEVDGPVPAGWRVPEVGPAFEGRPFARPISEKQAKVGFTRRVAVRDEVAGRLENMFGTRADWGKIGPVDIHGFLSRLGYGLKRLKLVGSIFQQADFAGRSGFSAFGGAIDDLLHARPISAAHKIVKLPQTLGKMAWANVSPARRAVLRRQMLSTEPILAERPGITMRGIREAGWKHEDISLLRRDLRSTVKAAADSPPAGWKGPLRAVNRRVDQLNQAIQNGLFEGVYPQAQIDSLRNFIVPRIARAHPDWTDAQIMRSAADEVNKMFSTLGNYQSVLGSSRNLQEFARALVFSTNESEALIRQALGTISGPNKGLWAEFYLGGALFLAGVANLIHFAATGQPLPFDRYAPLRPSRYSPIGVEYNPEFVSPQVPGLVGRGGFPVTVDLVMQMDTVLRLLDPAAFIKARENVLPRAIAGQIEGKDFFGRPLTGPEDRLEQLVADLALPIPGQHAAGIVRETIPGAERFIPEGESRLGPAGLATQISGINLRGMTNRDLLDLAARQWAQANLPPEQAGRVNELSDLDADQRWQATNQPDIKSEMDRRQATAVTRGDVRSQFYQESETLRGEFSQAQQQDDAAFQTGTMEAETWRDRFKERATEQYIRRDELAKARGIEFADKATEKPFDAALNAYFAVDVDKYTDTATGETEWDAFFGARDAAFASLSPADRQRAMAYIRRYDTPLVQEFRKASDLRSQYYDLPKYVGLTLEQGDQLDDFLYKTVPKLQRAYLRETGADLDRGQAIMSAIEMVRDPKVAQFLLVNFGPRMRVRQREGRRTVRLARADVYNPRRDAFLLEHQDVFARFFPDILERALSREQEAALGEQAYEALGAQ